MWKKAADMSVRDAISIVAGPREWGATRDSWLCEAARKTKTISARMMRSLWNGELRTEDHWAVREIKRQAEEVKRKSEIKQARQEAENLAENYENLAGKLNATNPNIYSEDVAALVHAARILRNLDRT